MTETIYTAAGERFTERDTHALASLVFKRFGNDLGAAAGAWRRMLQNTANDRDFEKLLAPAADAQAPSSTAQWSPSQLPEPWCRLVPQNVSFGGFMEILIAEIGMTRGQDLMNACIEAMDESVFDVIGTAEWVSENINNQGLSAQVQALAEAHRTDAVFAALASVEIFEEHLLKQCKAQQIVATFDAQVWVNDYSQSVNELLINVTDKVLALTLPEIHQIDDCDECSDRLCEDLSGWDGPHSVYVTEEICNFFEVEDIGDITEPMLTQGQAKHARMRGL